MEIGNERLQELIETGWLMFYEIKTPEEKHICTLIADANTGVKHIDWKWMADNLNTIHTKGTVTFPMTANRVLKEPIYLARNLWTCDCPEGKQYIHVQTVERCFRCGIEGSDNTMRLPYAKVVFDWNEDRMTVEEAMKCLNKLADKVVEGNDKTQ